MIKKSLITLSTLISCTFLVISLTGCKGITIQIGSDDTSSESTAPSYTESKSSSTESASANSTDNTQSESPSSENSDTASSNTAAPQVTVNITNDSVPDYGPPRPTIPQTEYYSNSFIFPDSSHSYLTQSQVASLNNYQLGIARNEIYARHGYTFDLTQFRNYFNSQSWYKPISKNVSLNSFEEYNVVLIKTEEDRRGVTW